MRYLTPLCILVFLLTLSLQSEAQKMDNKRLGKILTQVSDSLKGNEGYWQATYKGRQVIIITDQNHNRMRMISPITYINQIDTNVYKAALEANFHTVLDVKYAISEDIMWAVFIHPLKELSDHQVKDAIKQVYYGAATFGGTYSSTDLIFPAKE